MQNKMMRRTAAAMAMMLVFAGAYGCGKKEAAQEDPGRTGSAPAAEQEAGDAAPAESPAGVWTMSGIEIDGEFFSRDDLSEVGMSEEDMDMTLTLNDDGTGHSEASGEVDDEDLSWELDEGAGIVMVNVSGEDFPVDYDGSSLKINYDVDLLDGEGSSGFSLVLVKQ